MSTSPRIPRQGGFTLVELMVAMVIGLIIVLAAIGALIAARQGFRDVDVASQLRDNARFATDLIQRVAVQAGFKDVRFAATTRPGNTAGVAAIPVPTVFGFNNALADADDPGNAAVPRGASGPGSDVLVVRYQVPETFPGSGVADGSVIDCLGESASAAGAAGDRDSAVTSVFHVQLVDGESSLMCTVVDSVGTVVPARVLIGGIESFQVLYGTDGVNPGAATSEADSVAERYLRADELEVAGDPDATRLNWRRVRSLRIGLVLVGPPGSAADRDAQAFYPLGPAMWSAADQGSKFEPVPDGRLRQAVTFTVHLRNQQGL